MMDKHPFRKVGLSSAEKFVGLQRALFLVENRVLIVPIRVESSGFIYLFIFFTRRVVRIPLEQGLLCG